MNIIIIIHFVGSHVVSSVDLDVTLMVCLHEIYHKGQSAINGFDALPQSTDMSRGAHIARIKYYKNFLVSHSKDGKISDTDFNIIWTDLEMAIIGLGNQHDVKDAAEAKSKSLDYNSLQELVHIDTRLNYHTNEIAKQTSKIEKLETTVEAMEKAYYFGTQANNIDILIKHAEDRFVCERFVVTDYNKSTRYLISVSSDKLQMYMQRVFDDIVSSCNVNVKIRGNNNLNNVKYRTMLCDFMEHLSKDEIIAVMGKANNDFLNKMFVMKKNDIKDLFEYYNEEYKCFGIVLPDDMLQQYIKQWFGALVETKSTHKLMKNNRLFKCVAFRTALKSYMKQLATEHVAYIIQTGSTDFLNTMIVMSEDDINDFVKNQNERFCIVIPEGMVHNYIDRWFDDLTKYVGEDDSWSETYNAMPFSIRSREAKTRMVTEFINENRPLENLAFRYALRTYINQLTTEKIAFLIHTAKDSFSIQCLS
ncbi:unnamed protein product [Mytilus edulis]|uniref:DZIP3-like HEPN domain-containing protein n=1 Tax=Mytilus edulis TaxID=6550 RepID=A0A8S3RGL2_MYTED|nr:unnamed protein product [Mytilus edulis]